MPFEIISKGKNKGAQSPFDNYQKTIKKAPELRSFDIIWTNRAKKDLKALEKQTAKRIFEKICGLANTERLFLEKVKGETFYKFRVGDYRVFIDKYPLKNTLAILMVRHRKKAYKNL